MKGMNENIILLSLHPLFFIMGNTCNSDIDEIVSIIKIGVRNINFCWINVSNNIDYESLKIENGVLREKKNYLEQIWFIDNEINLCLRETML